MPEENEKKVKFIPTLVQLEEFASKLPPADSVEESVRTVSLSPDRQIDFERIRVHVHGGGLAYKWSYKGRVFINSKFATAAI